MHKSKFFITIFILLISSNIISQEVVKKKHPWFIGVEAGIYIRNQNIPKIDKIRSSGTEYQPYYDYYSKDYLYHNSTKAIYYFGIKPEYQISDRFSIASGIRFSFFEDIIKSDRSFFLWEAPGNTNNINYLRVANIRQTVYNVGIPLEIRFYPKKHDNTVRQYFVLGAMFNLAAFTDTDVNFANSAMAKYEQDIKNQLNKPNNFSTYYYLGIGLKIGKMNNPFGNIEFHFPMLSARGNRVSSFAELDEHIMGFNTSLKIPINIQK